MVLSNTRHRIIEFTGTLNKIIIYRAPSTQKCKKMMFFTQTRYEPKLSYPNCAKCDKSEYATKQHKIQTGWRIGGSELNKTATHL